MAELRFLGLSQDGSQLLLADSRGRKHSVMVESRLLAAMRLDGHPTGQREIALNTTFSPRQVQARLRSGATIADVAEEYGVPEDKVERFAGPPLADRAFTADQARQTVISSYLGERPLSVVVSSTVEAAGVDPIEIRWDSWLREDGLWQVLSSYPLGNLDQVATWVFDPRESSVRADDDTARALISGPNASTAPAISVVSSAESDSTPGDSSTTEASAGDTPAEAHTSTPRGAKRGKRASVPTWDEILFGSQSNDAEPTP